MIKIFLKQVCYAAAISVNIMYMCIDRFYLGAIVDLKHCGDGVTCQYCISGDRSLTVLRSWRSLVTALPMRYLQFSLCKKDEKRKKVISYPWHRRLEPKTFPTPSGSISTNLQKGRTAINVNNRTLSEARPSCLLNQQRSESTVL